MDVLHDGVEGFPYQRLYFKGLTICAFWAEYRAFQLNDCKLL